MNHWSRTTTWTILLTGLLAPSHVLASVRGKAVTETAEYVLERFGREAVEQGTETLARRIEAFAARHGDEALEAVRKVGPQAFRFADEAGEHAALAVKLMSRHGDEAVWLVSRPKSLQLVSRWGDNAAEAMLRHKEIAEPLIESLGRPAADALKAIDGRNARRLAMMQADGELAAIGRAEELLKVVGRYGDGAANFVWRNKGALTVAAALTAFLADPQAFLDGTTQLTSVATAPIQEVAREAARRTNWTAVLLVCAGIGGVLLMLRMWLSKPAPNGARG